MKNIFILFFIVLFIFTSCEDVLDKHPLDTVNDAIVFSDPDLIDAYVTEIYGEMHFLVNDIYGNSMYTPDFLAKNWFDMCMSTNLSDEATDGWVFSGLKYSVLTENGGLFELWPYDIIRRQNVFIDRIESAAVTEEYRKERIAEVRFLRAFTYFSLVKRYGGIPLITVAQELDAPEDELYPERAKEEDVYRFIIDEMDEIVVDMKPTVSDADRGRPTKYAALALQCRAALYAASSATWGNVELDGVVGVSPSSANEFWQIAYDAANLIIQAPEHSLYKKYWSSEYGDQVQNYQNIFLDETNNPEVIFAKRFNGPDGAGAIGHGWDLYQCPKGYNPWGGGNESAVYLDMVESYEYVDGTAGTLDRDKFSTGLWTTNDLWENKDPRFKASIYTQDDPWMGNTLQFYNGIIAEDGTIITSESYNGILARGSSNNNLTSFGVLKYLNPSYVNPDNNCSTTDWIVFRFGEVLLNYAEAAFELGKQDDALWAVNEIRERAGIKKLTSIDQEKIRHERKVELAFENHRYWDLRRWRTAETELSRNFTGLRYILDYQTGKFKLEFLDVHGASLPVFEKNKYYFPIRRDLINNNPKLVQNPGYNN